MGNKLTRAGALAAVSLCAAGAGVARAATDTIAVTNQFVPDGNGQFDAFAQPLLNAAGQVSFLAVLKNTSGGASDNFALFLTSPTPPPPLLTRARTGASLPEGIGQFDGLGAPITNDAGHIAFFALLRNTPGGVNEDRGIYRHTGGLFHQIAREAASVPEGNGFFGDFGTPVINRTGEVAFHADLVGTAGGTADNSGLYLHDGSSLVSVARENATIPGGGGQFSGFANTQTFSPSLAAGGVVAFYADLKNTGSALTDSAIYLRFPGPFTVEVARENALVPEGNGRFDSFNFPFALVTVNDNGQVAFNAALRNTAAPGTDDSGIYLYNNGPVVNIARENAIVPGGNGRFASFGMPAMNGTGQMAFRADLRNTAGLTLDDSGVYLHNGSAIVNVARENAPAPDGNGEFSGFGEPLLNNSGQVAFEAGLRNTSGAGVEGIYLADATEQLKVARAGETLAGKVILDLSLSLQFADSPQDGRGTALNDFGQIAYLAQFTDNTWGIFRFTPQVRWRSSGGGSWDAASNWTVSLRPASVHDVVINPAANLTVLGPTSAATVKSLQVGGNNGSGVATLQLQAGGTLTSTAPVVIAPTGVLTGSGTVNASVTNNGTVLADNLTIAGTLTSNGTISGTGSITTPAPIVINPSGVLTGSATINGSVTNNGTVLPVDLTITGTLTNNASVGGAGRLSATVVNAPTGSLSGDLTIVGNVTNNGTVLASNLDITGSLTNNATITGHGRITGALANAASAQLRVGSSQQLVFIGAGSTNAGRVEVLDGDLEFSQGLSNTGTIAGREMLLHFGGAGLTNSGNLQVSFGTSDVFGAIANNSGGKIVLSGNSNTTFYDNLTNGSGATLQVSTGSTAVFFGFVNNTGAVTGGGTKFFEGGSSGALGALETDGNTIVESGAAVTATRIREASLAVRGAAHVTADGTAQGLSRLGALAVSGGGVLALNDNDLLVDYAGASVEGAIRQLVRDGRTLGTGITTLATPQNDTTLAVADTAEFNRTSWLGQAIDASTIIGKYTYFGDANLDGMVTGDDYLAVDTNLSIGDDWVEGDFNMDNAVTGDDYLAIDTNLGKGTANPLAYAELKQQMIAKHVEMFGEEYLVKLAVVEANGITVVPEPGAAAAAMMSFAGLLLCRRRGQKPAAEPI